MVSGLLFRMLLEQQKNMQRMWKAICSKNFCSDEECLFSLLAVKVQLEAIFSQTNNSIRNIQTEKSLTMFHSIKTSVSLIHFTNESTRDYWQKLDSWCSFPLVPTSDDELFIILQWMNFLSLKTFISSIILCALHWCNLCLSSVRSDVSHSRLLFAFQCWNNRKLLWMRKFFCLLFSRF